MQVETLTTYRDDDDETRYTVTYDHEDRHIVVTDRYVLDPVPQGMTISEAQFIVEALSAAISHAAQEQ